MKKNEIYCTNKQCPKYNDCEKATMGSENMEYMNCKYYI